MYPIFHNMRKWLFPCLHQTNTLEYGRETKTGTIFFTEMYKTKRIILPYHQFTGMGRRVSHIL